MRTQRFASLSGLVDLRNIILVTFQIFCVFTQARSSTSAQAQAARFRFSPNSGHLAALHRSATKSADARRGAAVGGELRQAAGAAAWAAADKRAVRRPADLRRALPPRRRPAGAAEPYSSPPLIGGSPRSSSGSLAKHRHPPRLVARQPIWSPSGATQRYVRNWSRGGSARLALETTLMTPNRPSTVEAISVPRFRRAS